jgi:hypothetical protein
MRKFILIAAIFLVGAAGFSGCGSAQKTEKARIYPADDFTVNGDGTVTDNNTGLMWQQEDDDVRRSWNSAETYAETLTLGGHSDWRLPDIDELKSIRDLNQLNPSINSAAFPNTNSSYYWTSYIDHENSPSNAWYVNFHRGYINYLSKTSKFYVRCVRIVQ